MLPAVNTSAGCYMRSSGERSTVPVGPVQCTSCLMVLAGCLRGAKNENLQPFLKVLGLHLHWESLKQHFAFVPCTKEYSLPT